MATTANSGRKAQPPALKILHGRGKSKDGQDLDSAGAIIPAGVNFNRSDPVKPEHLSDDASWLWDRVVEQSRTIGLLKPLDAAALEVMCETFSRWREAVKERKERSILGKYADNTVAGAWVGVEERASKEFRAWCSEFGITPAAERNLVGRDGSLDNGSGDIF